MSHEPPIKEFAQEILEDIPVLFKNRPQGLRLKEITDYYGETSMRVIRAISHLEKEGHIQCVEALEQGQLHYYYRSTHLINENGKLKQLSQLQQQTYQYIYRTTKDANATILRTSYAQLARINNCSNGGIRTCIERLAFLNYLEIVSPGKQGKQSELLLKPLVDL